MFRRMAAIWSGGRFAISTGTDGTVGVGGTGPVGAWAVSGLDMVGYGCAERRRQRRVDGDDGSLDEDVDVVEAADEEGTVEKGIRARTRRTRREARGHHEGRGGQVSVKGAARVTLGLYTHATLCRIFEARTRDPTRAFYLMPPDQRLSLVPGPAV
jgi:hypothetical protein